MDRILYFMYILADNLLHRDQPR